MVMNHTLYTIGKVKDSMVERGEGDLIYKMAEPYVKKKQEYEPVEVINKEYMN
jgi:hypothetical protein